MIDYLIKQITRYPVKGLGAEYLEYADMTPGRGIANDRRFAIAHADSKFDEHKPEWLPRGNFLVVARSPALASLECAYIDEGSTLVIDGREKGLLRIPLNTFGSEEMLTVLFSSLCESPQPKPYKLVSIGKATSLTDSPTETVSIMNTASLIDFQNRLGVTLDRRRFRGNFWFNGVEAWEENAWVGKEISIGSIRLKITETICRCAAIEANPATGRRDVQALQSLKRHYNHTVFGVLAQIEVGGRISRDDTLVLPS